MKILVIGSPENQSECIQKFGDGHTYQIASNEVEAEVFLPAADLIFNFVPKNIKLLSDFSGVVFIDTTRITLAGLLKTESVLKAKFFGFCGFPTFLDRELLEVSLANENDRTELQSVCDALDTKFGVVADQVGLVTPRIICMIINEAYYTVAEGTATREDIDLAMKLGTNYPFGPFEWGQRIGLQNVVELLRAVHLATSDDRYLICDMLRQEAS